MDISEIRRQNLKLLIDQHAGSNQAKFGQLVDWNRSTVNQYLHGARNIGNPSARKLEKKLGLHKGWMDTPHTLGAIDIEPLKDAILAVEAGIARNNIPADALSPEKRARIYLEVYRQIKNGTLTDEVVDSLLRLAL